MNTTSVRQISDDKSYYSMINYSWMKFVHEVFHLKLGRLLYLTAGAENTNILITPILFSFYLYLRTLKVISM